MKDYSNLKNNTFSPEQQAAVNNAISRNLSQIRSPNPLYPLGNSTQPTSTSGGLFMNSQPSQMILPPQNIPPTTLFPGNKPQATPASGGLFINPQSSQITPQPTALFGGNKPQATPASGGLFMNPQPSPMVTNIPTNQPSGLQSSSLPTQTPKLSNEPTVTQPPETKESLIKYVKPTAKSVNKPLELNSGSFSYEFNKMLFVSSLIQIMEKHNMTMPENLLDNTDFAAQLLAFLEQNNISLPTENIPQFQISSVAPLESENNDEEEEEYNNYC